MKKTVLALTAVFALTGAALAENPNLGTESNSTVNIDTTATHSIDGTSSQPKLGADIDPWFLSNM